MLLKAAVIYQFLLTKYCSLEQVLLDECGTFPASFAPHNWFRNTKVQVAVSPQGLWLISATFQGARLQFTRVPRPWTSIHQNSTAFEFNSPPIPPPSISIPPNSNAPEFNAPQFHPLYPPIFPPLRQKKFNTTQIIRKASRAPFQGSVSQARSSRLTLGNALRSPPETRQSRHRKPFQHGKHSGLRVKLSLAGALYVTMVATPCLPLQPPSDRAACRPPSTPPFIFLFARTTNTVTRISYSWRRQAGHRKNGLFVPWRRPRRFYPGSL